MFVSVYQHGTARLDPRLAVSRDGIAWTWPQVDVPFIDQGEMGEFDNGTISVAQGMIKSGDELWQYYSGTPLQQMESEIGLDELLRSPQTTYSRVASRLDGFVSAEADSGGGSFLTPPLMFEGDTLHLNVKVRGGGAVRIGLLDENGNDVKGRAVADGVPITGDHIDIQVAWESGTDIGNRYGKPTQLRVEMTDAALYSFQMQRTIFVK